MNFKFDRAERNLFQRVLKKLTAAGYPLETRRDFWQDYKEYRLARKTMERRQAVMGLPDGSFLKKVLKTVYYYQ